jgi:CO/xanthine dehydrogenase FAD-binding subunit
MKPARFEYADPATLPEALTLLGERGDEAKILAGGQSLVPLLNMRLAMPEVLVDINGVAGLDSYSPGAQFSAGPLVRQRTVERSTNLGSAQPLLQEAIHWVGHPQIRNRGTIVGSLAHADPAAEMPLVWQAQEGTLELSSARGTRTVAAEDFFVHIMTTACQPDEIVIRAGLPTLAGETGTAFMEVARRHGDFAVVSVAVLLTLQSGFVSKARIALGGVGPTPLRARRAEEKLIGSLPEVDAFADSAAIAAGEAEPASDVHGTAEYRREVAATLVRRSLAVAAERAGSREVTEVPA